MSAKEREIELLPPSINKSDTYFTVENGKIRFGLASLKNVGVQLVNEIVKERNENGEYKDIADFIKRTNTTGVNKRAIEAFILSGAFDEFNYARSQLMAVYESIVERVQSDKKNQDNGQLSMFDTLLKNDNSLTVISYPNIPEFVHNEKLKQEKEVVGIYLSGHPLDKYLAKFKDFNFNTQIIKEYENEKAYDEEGNEIAIEGEQAEILTDGMQVTFGGIVAEIKKVYTRRDNKEMAIVTVEDFWGTVDIMIFNAQWLKLKKDLEEDAMATFTGKISLRDGESPIVILENVEIWNQSDVKKTVEEKEQKAPTLYLKYDVQDKNLNEKIFTILDQYKGNSKVIVRCSSTEQIYKINKLVQVSSRLTMELQAYIADEFIKIA